MSYDMSTRGFSFYSEDFNLIGDHEFSIEAYLTEYLITKTIEQAEKATLTVGDPCPDPDSVTAPGQITLDPYLYTADNPKVVFTMSPFAVVPPACFPEYTCETISGPAAIDLCSLNDGTTISTFDADSGNFEF